MAEERQAFAIYRPRSTEIRAITGTAIDIADVYLTEEHERRVTKTRYPLESGASLTDHAVREPDRVKITGWRSHLLPSDPNLASSPDRSALAWEEINRLMNARALVQVSTLLATYSNMLIVRAIAPVTRASGRDLQFTLEFEEVLVAELEEIRFGEDPTPDGPAAQRTGGLSRGGVYSRDHLEVMHAALSERDTFYRNIAIDPDVTDPDYAGPTGLPGDEQQALIDAGEIAIGSPEDLAIGPPGFRRVQRQADFTVSSLGRAFSGGVTLFTGFFNRLDNPDTTFEDAVLETFSSQELRDFEEAGGQVLANFGDLGAESKEAFAQFWDEAARRLNENGASEEAG